MGPKTLSSHECLKQYVTQYLSTNALSGNTRTDTGDILTCLPKKWQQHADVILFPSSALQHEFYSTASSQFWQGVADVLKVRRLGLMGKTLDNDYREPTVSLLLGEDGWTEHTDNKVRYCFDVTKTMFSSGNITEKVRMSKLDCTDEVIVDLYAGIGYYTLQLLTHTKVKHIHACEWNTNAVIALQKGLVRNRVEGRCTVHPGDNRQLTLSGVADRVLLGLLPTSRPGWEVACRVLKPTGGVLHIHDCLNTKGTDKSEAKSHYTTSTVKEITRVLESISSGWVVETLHLETVKSYAPHIYHIVLDLYCHKTGD